MSRKSIHKSVFGLYESLAEIQQAIHGLKEASFIEEDIFVLASQSRPNGGFAHVRGSKAPECALLGVVTGGMAGAIIGWSFGAGAFNAAVPFMFALAGMGFFAPVFGVLGALIGLAFPEYKARRFQGSLKNGGVLMSVHVDDPFRKKRAKEILKNSGARFISVGREVSSGMGWTGSRRVMVATKV